MSAHTTYGRAKHSTRTKTARCAFIPAGVKHELNFSNSIIHGNLFIERDSADFLYFKRRFPYSEQSATLFQDDELVKQFLWIYEENPDKPLIESCLNTLLNCDDTLHLNLDVRVQTAIDRICDAPESNFSGDYLAGLSDLSRSPFSSMETVISCSRTFK